MYVWDFPVRTAVVEYKYMYMVVCIKLVHESLSKYTNTLHLTVSNLQSYL